MIPAKWLLPLILLGTGLRAQHQFVIKDGSGMYDARISVATCDKEKCEGKATVTLYKKGTTVPFQSFTSGNLNFYLNRDQQPSVNIVQLYNEQSPLIFNDFNFDGTEDLAIRNGNESNYGGPSYDVYVFNSTRKQFVPSKELTGLAHENLGIFKVDAIRKRLVTYSKSGCCWHLTTEYAVMPQKGLVKVYELEEDATGGDNVTVTRSELFNSQWKKTVKTYPIKEYYKD